MQLSGQTSIQIRSLRDIMVTTTLDLVFKLVIFLDISLIILSLSISILPVFTLTLFRFFETFDFTHVSFAFNLPLNEIARTQFL